MVEDDEPICPATITPFVDGLILLLEPEFDGMDHSSTALTCV